MTEKLQFRVLYRQFLFRMVDLELLSSSAQGDISRLLGQLAAMLIFFSSGLGLFAVLFNERLMPPRIQLVTIWSIEHFLIETTMLVVGLFAVLSWDSAFPDRRDILVLAPLPVRARTMFVAKLAALGVALGLGVVCFNCLGGLAWPMLHFTPEDGFALRSLAAYWIAVALGGIFLFGSVLTLQGLAAQLLPRRHFLRISALLQLGAFCAMLAGVLLEPMLEIPEALVAPANRHWLEWMPPYWFWGLFEKLNGSAIPGWAPPGVAEVWATLARRAWMGFAVSIAGTGILFLLAYFRTVRRIVEEPDIAPGSGVLGRTGMNWLPRFGAAPLTAVVHFSVRTLLRSRQHRLLLAFYLGIGFSFLILVKNAPREPGSPDLPPIAPALIATVVMMCCWVVGTRVVFSRPLEIRANWIFRVAGTGGGAVEALAAARRSLLVLAVIPTWVVSLVSITNWPWREAVSHLAILGFFGIVVAEVCLYGFRKIPFTCTYLPGKTRLNLLGPVAYGFFIVLFQLAQFEIDLLSSPIKTALFAAGLAAIAIALQRYTSGIARAEAGRVQFEEVETPAVLTLGLNRDGTPV